MNRVFIDIEAIPEDRWNEKVGYNVVVADDYVEDIQVYFMEAPDFTDRPAHEIASVVAGAESQAHDVIRAAILNGTPVWVNGGEASLDGLKSLLKAAQAEADRETAGLPSP